MSRPPGSSIRELLSLRDRMTRLFEESLGRFQQVAQEGLGAQAWSPPVDIFEQGGRLVLRLDLPGLARDDVRVTVEEGALVVEGERFLDPLAKAEAYHRMERAYGPFRRAFRLPVDIVEREIQAEMQDGVLEVVIPRKRGEDASPIRVTVK
jgi:HSP20 family protein